MYKGQFLILVSSVNYLELRVHIDYYGTVRIACTNQLLIKNWILNAIHYNLTYKSWILNAIHYNLTYYYSLILLLHYFNIVINNYSKKWITIDTK